MQFFIGCLFLSIYLAGDNIIGDCNTCLFTQKNYSISCSSNNTLHCSAARANCQSLSSGCILDACLLEPLILGIGNDPLLFSAIFTTSNAINQFLPANGTPSFFTSNTINPLTTAAGVFAGELLTAILNYEFFPVKFLRFSPNCSFVEPIFYNMTLETLLYISNYIISGDTSIFTPELTPAKLTQALFVYNNAKANATLGQCFVCSVIIEEPTVEPTALPAPTTGDNGNTSILIVIIVVIFFFVLVIVIAIVVLVYIMKKRTPPKLPSRFK